MNTEMLLEALYEIYPLVFSVNLKKNTFEILKNCESMRDLFGNESTYDDFGTSQICRIPYDIDKAKFKQNFLRENLIEKSRITGGVSGVYHVCIKDSEDIHQIEYKIIFKKDSKKDLNALLLIRCVDIEAAEREYRENKGRIADAFFNAFFSEDDYPLTITDTDELAKRLKSGQEQLKAAKERAEAANDAKTVFLFNMSHDIRTPMNAILGFSDMALKHTDSPAKVREIVSKIKSSGEQLLKLINEILDMSSIEGGKITLDKKPGDLKKCLTDVAEIIKNEATERRITFEDCEFDIEDRPLLFDEPRVSQILLNVLGNAVKYTHPGGIISFKATQKESFFKSKSAYEFVIKDNGVGMSPDFVDRVFDPFSREKSSTISGIAGTGLGLSITKRLLDLMNGTIDIFTRPGIGTTVTINLEFDHPGERMEVETKIVDNRILTGKKVLVVEDNEFNREIAKDMLMEAGALVDEVSDGIYAVSKVVENGVDYYDAILMDIQMPIMDGYEATRSLFKLSEFDTKGSPVIAMTANAFSEDKEKAYGSGMSAFVSKPVKVEEFIRTLEKCIK
ncbi:MAG: response regulator [Acetatifactor sp.]|nr:response regulator [Acetatifactor sp.]